MLRDMILATQMPRAPRELNALRSQSKRIKSFVTKHGTSSALIFARAMAASFNGETRLIRFLLNEAPSHDPQEACRIVRALGYEAAALLPQLIATYYCTHLIDVSA